MKIENIIKKIMLYIVGLFFLFISNIYNVIMSLFLYGKTTDNIIYTIVTAAIGAIMCILAWATEIEDLDVVEDEEDKEN